MTEENKRATIVIGWSIVALTIWAVLGSADGGGQSKDVTRFRTTEEETAGKGGAVAKTPKRTQAEAEKSCADPAACREANRKAYARAGKPGWLYADVRDPMRGTIRSANIDSANKLEFAFPYDGGATATLSLRKIDGDLNVLIRVDKGQFICYGMGNTELRAKFDGREVEDYTCGQAADGSSNVIFIRSESSFLASIKKAKTLIIEATFYQAGARQMTFHVEGLNWK